MLGMAAHGYAPARRSITKIERREPIDPESFNVLIESVRGMKTERYDPI
jgi:hypothetical protein